MHHMGRGNGMFLNVKQWKRVVHLLWGFFFTDISRQASKVKYCELAFPFFSGLYKGFNSSFSIKVCSDQCGHKMSHVQLPLILRCVYLEMKISSLFSMAVKCNTHITECSPWLCVREFHRQKRSGERPLCWSQIRSFLLADDRVLPIQTKFPRLKVLCWKTDILWLNMLWL